MNAHTKIALPLTVADIIDEYEVKLQALPDAVQVVHQAWDDLVNASSVLGTWVEPIGSKPSFHDSTLRMCLLKSGWQAVYNRLNIDALASAKDKKLFERTMAAPPPLTLETAKATFGDYLIRPRFHILRGLAEVFCSLDPAYKSHSKVKIGKKGLPKRVVINWGEYGHGYGFDQFRDMINAMAALRGQVPFDWNERSAIQIAYDLGEDAILDGRVYRRVARHSGQRDEAFKTIDRGITVRRFKNGNAHVFFDEMALDDVNKGLAEFYGEVLPDAEPENVKPSVSTAVSKDLQFYWSPPAVVEAAVEYAGINKLEHYRGNPPMHRVLEPSCGDGRIMDELRARGCDVLGMEYHPGRAAEARAKGHAVVCTNFLEEPATGDFDMVVMNPPFAGRHYVKHVRHAIEFLKPGGTLVAILPASAHYDHGELDDLIGRWDEGWRDLPVGSFADAGTNVPTIMLRVKRK